MSSQISQRWRCVSCSGKYSDAGGYRHVCPEGTKNPRNENIQYDLDAQGLQVKGSKKTISGGKGRLKA